MNTLTQHAVDVLLERYHSFHDAQYRRIELVPPMAPNDKFACNISLLAQDHSNGRAVHVVFRISGLEEFQIRYNEAFDYPNVRDDIAIKNFDGKVFFDLGFAAAEPQSPDDVRQSDIYFVGTGIAFDEVIAPDSDGLEASDAAGPENSRS
jgi:hypothetical protein